MARPKAEKIAATTIEVQHLQAEKIAATTIEVQHLLLKDVTRPSCSATSRGQLIYQKGGAGERDLLLVCLKDAADAFAWRYLYWQPSP